MKQFISGAALAVAMLAAPAQAADVGVSVSIGQPGFYGQIDIGNFPRPQVIYEQPVVIRRGPAAYAPVYLRVPPGHEKHWDKHCHEYGACGRPVYFVRDRWYNEVYAPQYRQQRGGSSGRGDHHDGPGYSDDRHGGPGKGHGHDKGHGNGNGNGNGNGKHRD